jgi:hypothetical protein
MIGEIPGCETAIVVAEHSLDCALWIYRAMSAGNLPHPIDETANW